MDQLIKNDSETRWLCEIWGLHGSEDDGDLGFGAVLARRGYQRWHLPTSLHGIKNADVNFVVKKEPKATRR